MHRNNTYAGKNSTFTWSQNARGSQSGTVKGTTQVCPLRMTRNFIKPHNSLPFLVRKHVGKRIERRKGNATKLPRTKAHHKE